MPRRLPSSAAACSAAPVPSPPPNTLRPVRAPTRAMFVKRASRPVGTLRSSLILTLGGRLGSVEQPCRSPLHQQQYEQNDQDDDHQCARADDDRIAASKLLL